MSEHTVSALLGDKEVVLSTGKMAWQANGAVKVTMGETEILVTASANDCHI